MADHAKEQGSTVAKEAEFWQKTRDKYLDGINDRIKTMALGTLVLIWGLFIGDEHKGLVLSKGSRIALLVVALGSVLVLLLDYLEYLMGYLAARQRIPGAKMTTFNYDGWKRGSLIAKHVAGCISLLTLTAVLAVILLGTVVHAQSASDLKAFQGHWCGNDQDGNNYMVLDINLDNNNLTATWSNRQRSDEECTVLTAIPYQLSLWCGDHIQLDVEPDRNALVADWHETVPDARGTNTLVDCSH